jgi:phosphoribosylaminoimidazolecarboxamide formyltransferase/IMP cyclohydrolase
VSPDPDDRIECAYGENAWQTPAALVATPTDDALALGRFEHIEGAALSYNNLVEVDRQLQTITHIAAALDRAGSTGRALAVGSKHGNACGASAAHTSQTAVEHMLTGDARAIFGGCVMLSFDVDAALARTLIGYESPTRRLLDLVTAASFSDEAVEVLARKQGKCRLLANPALNALDQSSLDRAPRTRYVRGGSMEQPNYTFVLDLSDPAVQRSGTLTDTQAHDLLLAWAVGSTSNSNTVTLAREGQLLGNGVGQQDRVGGCALALARARDAGHATEGSVAYSDSFFPFPDGPQLLIDAGVAAVFCTTGSVRDEEVRETFTDAGVTLVQLPDRAARGFFGH